MVKRYLVLKDHWLVSKALILIFWGSFGILIVHLCQVQIKFISICWPSSFSTREFHGRKPTHTTVMINFPETNGVSNAIFPFGLKFWTSPEAVVKMKISIKAKQAHMNRFILLLFTFIFLKQFLIRTNYFFHSRTFLIWPTAIRAQEEFTTNLNIVTVKLV